MSVPLLVELADCIDRDTTLAAKGTRIAEAFLLFFFRAGMCIFTYN
jgi:hypothetical protein